MEKIKLTREMMEKAKEAKTVEELLLLAKENKLDLTDERAAIYFEKINPKVGQLEDEELDNVSGGGCEQKEYTCICGSKEFYPVNSDKPTSNQGYEVYYRCKACGKKL